METNTLDPTSKLLMDSMVIISACPELETKYRASMAAYRFSEAITESSKVINLIERFKTDYYSNEPIDDLMNRFGPSLVHAYASRCLCYVKRADQLVSVAQKQEMLQHAAQDYALLNSLPRSLLNGISPQMRQTIESLPALLGKDGGSVSSDVGHKPNHAFKYGVVGLFYGVVLGPAAVLVGNSLIAAFMAPLAGVLGAGFIFEGVFRWMVFGQSFTPSRIVILLYWWVIGLLPAVLLPVIHVKSFDDLILSAVLGAVWCAVVAGLLDHFTGMLTSRSQASTEER
jgi:hypothetical protein